MTRAPGDHGSGSTGLDERERAIRRLVWSVWARGVGGNLIAVAMSATVTSVTARAYFDDAAYDRYVQGGTLEMLLSVPPTLVVAWLFSRQFVRRRMSWYVEERAPSRTEIDRFASVPRYVALASFFGWTVNEGGFLLYLALVEHIAWPRLALAKEISTNVFGFAMGTTLAYLLTERALRRFVALVLPANVSDWPRTMGLRARLLALWFTVAGAPLSVVVFTLVGLTPEQRSLVTPGLMVTGGLATAIGFSAFFLAGRTLTDPLDRLKVAFRRIAGGDLTPRVQLQDVGEVGQLEAGFNRMVEGLSALESDNARLQDELRAQLEEVRASRVRIVEAADAERARIERNLHDGAQQRLLSLAFLLREVERKLVANGSPDVRERVQTSLKELDAAMAELRELARGIHPSILDEEGLGPALTSLAERATLPVQVSVTLPLRLPTAVEVTAYFVAAEALTNIARYADASRATIEAIANEGVLELRVSDDGKGGADPQLGSGLRGLADRISALGGTFEVESRPKEGTTIAARVPCG